MKDFENDGLSSTSPMDVFMVLSIADNQVKLLIVFYLVMLVYPCLILVSSYNHYKEDQEKEVKKERNRQFISNSKATVMVRNLPQNVSVDNLQRAINKIMTNLP